MGKLEIRCIVVGMIQTNCYVLYDDEIKKAIITDPGDNADYIASCISTLGVSVEAILLTHGHGDHFKALQEIKDRYHVPVYVHKDDVYRLKYQGGFVPAAYKMESDDVLLEDGDKLEIGGIKIEVIHTPGHTEGGVCYYLPDHRVLLSGDTLFCHSWGRTDFPGGDEDALFRSIREKLLPLPEDTLVLPGHEASTTIEEERRVHGYSGT